MQIMIDLMRGGRPASDVMAILAQEEEPFLRRLKAAGRNDDCPCGSGLKKKRCHGAGTHPILLPHELGSPRPPATERGRRAAAQRTAENP
jgi:hypothetical protein